VTLNDLLEEFNVVIDSAEGLSELRSLILGLAVRGKLVPQDPNDEPASKLLKKIEAEKQRLYKLGEIRKPKKLPLVEEAEYFSNTPNNWFWTRLGEVGDWGAGATPSRGNSEYYGGDIPWLKTGELNDSFISGAEEFITLKGFNNSSVRLCKPGDVLIAMYGATIGKLGILEIEATTNQACCACTVFKGFYNIYLFYYLLAMREDFRNQGAGGAQPNFSKTKIEHTVLPLPPIEEQHCIVAKIEALFAEVDELEAQLEQQTKLDEKLQLAVNAEVQQAPDTEVSKAAWNIITSSFDSLYHTPKSIDNLKKNILNEAVRGRLVPQDPNESIFGVTSEIDMFRNKLCDEGERRVKKKRIPVTNDEVPWEVPKKWNWLRFSDFILFIDYRGKTPKKVDSGIPLITAKNIRNGHINKNPREFIEESEYEKWMTRGIPVKGDLLFTTEAPLGNIAVINFEYKFALAQRSICFRLLSNKLDPYFIMYLMMSDIFMKYLVSHSTGMTAKGIKASKLKTLPFPLPPVEEQYRIVRRIEEIFAICDAYKTKLEQREKVNKRLVKGLVQEVLEGV
jgi:type I restriction enzyme S subunit